jgi:hypothetical protein
LPINIELKLYFCNIDCKKVHEKFFELSPRTSSYTFGSAVPI